MDWMNNLTLERRRVKYAWIYVNYRLEVKIVIPLRFKENDLQAFIHAKSPWVTKKLEHYKKVRAEAPVLMEKELWYFGERFTPDFDASDPVATEKWYRAEAKKHFTQRVAELAAYHGFTYNKISIRAARTRWGSCSVKKNLSFNWRLMKAPEFVVDYLILHELAHTVVLNHSRKFWQLVAKVCPRYEEAKAWLKQNGPRL
jgi:predicted metal-dependent hydrolase